MNEFPTNSTKLSQVCHICGNAVKKPLRWHICCCIEVQKDLYRNSICKWWEDPSYQLRTRPETKRIAR